VVSHGGFAAAARAQGTPKSSLSRRVPGTSKRSWGPVARPHVADLSRHGEEAIVRAGPPRSPGWRVEHALRSKVGASRRAAAPRRAHVVWPFFFDVSRRATTRPIRRCSSRSSSGSPLRPARRGVRRRHSRQLTGHDRSSCDVVLPAAHAAGRGRPRSWRDRPAVATQAQRAATSSSTTSRGAALVFVDRRPEFKSRRARSCGCRR